MKRLRRLVAALLALLLLSACSIADRGMPEEYKNLESAYSELEAQYRLLQERCSTLEEQARDANTIRKEYEPHDTDAHSDSDSDRHAFDEGQAAGYSSGYSDGYEEGQTAGYASGLSEGKDSGYESGYAKGYEEGLAGKTASRKREPPPAPPAAVRIQEIKAAATAADRAAGRVTIQSQTPISATRIPKSFTARPAAICPTEKTR